VGKTGVSALLPFVRGCERDGSVLGGDRDCNRDGSVFGDSRDYNRDRNNISTLDHLRLHRPAQPSQLTLFAARFEAVSRSRWSRFPASLPPHLTHSLTSVRSLVPRARFASDDANASRRQRPRCGGGGRRGPAPVDGPQGKGGDAALCRASCSAHCGRKWSTNEMLLPSELLLRSLSLNSIPETQK